MSLRPTLRRNGKHMATLSASWNLDGDQVAELIALQAWWRVADYEGKGTDGGEPRDLGKGEAEEAVRDQLYSHGLGQLEVFGERLEPSTNEAVQWAARQVRRHWPDLETTIQDMKW